MRKGILAAFAGAIALLALLTPVMAYSADVSNFARSYGPGSLIEGDLNLKLSGDSADLAFNVYFDSINKSISLTNLLNNSGIAYNCSPSNCLPKYSSGSGSPNYPLNPGLNYAGLLIPRGTNVQVSSLSFDISGSGGVESCGVPPVDFDLLDDGNIDWSYAQPSDSLCYSPSTSPNYDSGSSDYNAVLTDGLYCEKMNLDTSGKYRLGADIESGSSALVHLSITDGDSGDNAGCDATPSNGIVYCDVNFTGPSKKDYYVCVSSSTDSNHLLRSETQSPTCGYGFSGSQDFYAFQCNDTLTDYGIYAAPFKIRAFSNTTHFDSDEFSKFNSENDLPTYIQNYLDAVYGGNCSGGCVVPMSLNLNQQITLSNLSFVYSATGLGIFNQHNFYASSRISALVSTNGTVDVPLSNSGITVPSDYGTYDYSLKIGSSQIDSGSLEVAQVPIINSITPISAAALIPEVFTASVSSPLNNSIREYDWDYGDGSSDTTTVPYTNHSYDIGTFQLTLKVVDSQDLASTRTFTISTYAPRDYINATLIKKRANINLMNNVITQLPSWYSGLVSDEINLNKMSSDFSILESDFRNPQADYSSIKQSLDSFVTYTGINDDDIGSSPVVPSVNLDYLRKLGDAINSSQEEETINGITSWDANLQMKEDYVVKYAVADTSSENNLDLATILTITFIPTQSYNNVYFVLELPQGINSSDVKLNGDYDVQDLDGALGFTFVTLNQTTVEIALPGRHLNLGMFAAPISLQSIFLPNVKCGNGICEQGESYKDCPQDCQRPLWIPIFWGIVIWGIVAGGIYWIWRYYAKKYDLQLQERLFKEKSDYLKLTSFIAEELNKGKGGKEIRKELSDAGWKSEQTEYAMTKVLKQTRNFQRQTVINFIANEKGSGKIDKEIKDELTKAGWSPGIIDYAFKKVSKQRQKSKQSVRKS